MKRVSTKRAARQGERRAAVATATDRDRTCVAAPLIPEVPDCWGRLEPHEPLFRGRGGDIYDPDAIAMCCHVHHRWIHDHPKFALERGLAERSRPLAPVTNNKEPRHD